jgi:putative two-component system response regulator
MVESGGTMTTKKKVLIIARKAEESRSIALMIAPWGYEAVMAGSGREGLEQTKRGALDLILMDYTIPLLESLEIVTHYREDDITGKIPLILLTPQSIPEFRALALEKGVDEFLTKPLEEPEVKARLRSVIRSREGRPPAAKTREIPAKVLDDSLETVFRLAQAAEFHDRDAGEHIRRVSEYAASIAAAMGLDRETVEMIRYGSAMHDLGKAGIPGRILMKPAKLEADEWEIMKEHTTLGARILDAPQKDFLTMARNIALTHHEKWDGTGYPQGLKGSEIPLEGRITAIVDVFDALTSRRPFREPLPVDESLLAIKMSRGIQFDPNVVEAFFSVIEDMMRAKNIA